MRGVGWVAERGRSLVTGVSIVYARRGLRVPRAIALTFDDGPSEWTPPILDALAAQGARGTFFVLGRSIEGREEIVRRTAAEGHELGNHAYSHTDPQTLDDDTLRRELDRTSTRLEELTGRRPRLFRPPYAGHDVRVARVARAAGLSPTVLRSVDPADWREPDAGRIASRVLAEIRPGAIVCLHDGLPPHTTEGTLDRTPTVTAVSAILDGVRARGLVAITVGELIGGR